MQSFSGLAATRATEASSTKRVHYRHQVQSLVYVNLDEGNGGIIRNLSQDGIAIQAVGALHPGQLLRIRFDLLNPKTRLDLQAEVAWASPSGQAGLRFVDPPPQAVRQLNDWIFINLLRSMEHASPVFQGAAEEDELILSGSGRTAIRLPRRLPRAPAIDPVPTHTLRLSWWPRPVSLHQLARFMDGLVVFSAILTFFCVFLAVAHTLPSWPVALGVVGGVSGFFTALYWSFCAVLGCGTAGVQLARMAMGDCEAEKLARDAESRFR
jgi:hypothetical protein